MKLIDFAIEQQVDLLLLAGDNWDGGHSDYGSLLFFAEEMTRLNRHGIRVAMIQGNHDAENLSLQRAPMLSLQITLSK